MYTLTKHIAHKLLYMYVYVTFIVYRNMYIFIVMISTLISIIDWKVENSSLVYTRNNPTIDPAIILIVVY